MKTLIIQIFMLSLTGLTFATDPETLVGQKAFYQLDKNPKRTISLLKDGNFLAVIKRYLPHADHGPAMEVDLNYRFNVQLMGEQTGVETSQLDYEYFTKEFLEKLRKEGKYESPNFKAVHQGYKDVRTLEGKLYPQCDVILLYDITDTANMDLRSGLTDFLAGLVDVNPKSDVQDLKVLTHVYPGIPVLSAVQIDISGKYEGMNIKAGADYQTP